MTASFMTKSEFDAAIFLLCQTHKCSATSGFRTQKHNMYVGGHFKSQHLTGMACDIIPDSWPAVTQELLTHFKRNNLNFLIEKTHIHVYVRSA